MIDLSIILLTWNGRELVCDCLRSIDREIRARSDGGEITVQTIVVDNGSEDGSVEAIRREFPWAELVALPANRGFAAGNNAGLPLARGRHLCFLNNDTVVLRDGFEQCVRFLDSHPEVGAVGPQLIHPDGRKQNSIHNFPSLLLEVVPRGVLEMLAPSRFPSKRFSHSGPIAVEAVLGACMFARREVIERVGGLPEDYFFFLEETDWFYQIHQAGYRVIHHPGAKLVHIHGASTKKRVPLPTRIEYHRSLYRFFVKHHGPRKAKLVRALRVAKGLASVLLLAPLGLVSSEQRARAGQRLGILRWHAAGRPASWGLSGVGRSAEKETTANTGADTDRERRDKLEDRKNA